MRIKSLILSCGLTVTAIAAGASSVHAFSLFIDNRSGFNTSLNQNARSTVVDNGTSSFGSAPSKATGLVNVTRTGLINGSTFSYAIYDVNFSETPNGKLIPGVAGGDISSPSTLRIETPINQEGAKGTAAWGVDSRGATDNNSTRNAALFNFSATPGNFGIGHFGVDLHDFESDPLFRLGELRLYKKGSLVYSHTINWGNGFNGNGQTHFLGIVANGTSEFFDQVAIVLGDDNLGRGFQQAWAADNFTFGQAYHSNPTQAYQTQEIPESSTIIGILLALGLRALFRKQKTI
jgi:hypothetical protein